MAARDLRSGSLVVFGLALLTLLLAAPEPVSAQNDGRIVGQVVDVNTGQPLPMAAVRIRDLGRTQGTDAEGRFTFEGLPARAYRLVGELLGYAPNEIQVVVEPGATTEVTLQLRYSPIHLPGVVVTGTGRERGAADLYRPTSVLSGAELDRSLASSVPATLARVPGFSAQYNGPGATRPTIRGMGGDRVLMLEDGQRTGDLYQTASDHGVMVEPLTARRMEVVRGPAGLLYGSNALGGVVNVIRDDVPRVRLSRFQSTASTHMESVNDGITGGLLMEGPAGPLNLRSEFTARFMGDTRTPEGTLESSDTEVYNASIGASVAESWGFAGVSYRYYDNQYGVPGEFAGELIPGAHPGGVDIEATRHLGRFRAAYQRPILGFFQSAELDANITRYIHDEIEAFIDGDAIPGSQFRQTSGEVNLMADHDHTGHDHPTGIVRAEGALGVSFQGRDLWAGGANPGTRSGHEWSLAAFGYEEFAWEVFRLQLGARYDFRRVAPADLSDLVIRTTERRIEKPVSERTFHSFSGSVATLRDFGDGWTVGASLARSFRTPSIEEMFSEGPHLADFSFDIGSPDLDPEIGVGVDLFLRGNRPGLSVEVATYLNRVSNYIFYLQTGETVRVIREGARPRVTPVYEAQGTDARFVGAEGRVQWEAMPGFILDGTVSYTRAQRTDDADPLPQIPPLSFSGEARYENQRWFVSASLDGARAQDRIPGPVEIGDITELPENPTDGYGLVHLGGGVNFNSGAFRHSVSLQVRNVTDAVWRDHLSRIKDIAPQPGRNIQLTYRVRY